MQIEKANTILATYGEEPFEFAPVQQIDDDRYVSNVQNHSHDDGEAHIHPVFFEVDRDETAVQVRVVGCGCPAAEYHDGECKHCETAARCAALLAAVLEVALEDSEGETDAHTTEQTDGEQPVATDGGHPTKDCACGELPDDYPVGNCFKEGDR